jgi:hypothetical protein
MERIYDEDRMIGAYRYDGVRDVAESIHQQRPHTTHSEAEAVAWIRNLALDRHR